MELDWHSVEAWARRVICLRAIACARAEAKLGSCWLHVTLLLIGARSWHALSTLRKAALKFETHGEARRLVPRELL